MPLIDVLVMSDDAQTLRVYVHAVLAQPSMRLSGAVTQTYAAKALLDATTTDVLLVDCQLSQDAGVALVRHVAAQHPCCAALVVTPSDGDDCGAAALAAGAVGCLTRHASPQSIARAILQAHVDGARSILAMRGQLLPRGFKPSTSACAAPALLTPRETEILRLIEKGFLFDTVSALLDISPHTVVAHTRKIYRKLAVHTRGEAVHEAIQMGLL